MLIDWVSIRVGDDEGVREVARAERERRIFSDFIVFCALLFIALKVNATVKVLLVVVVGKRGEKGVVRLIIAPRGMVIERERFVFAFIVVVDRDRNFVDERGEEENSKRGLEFAPLIPLTTID